MIVATAIVILAKDEDNYDDYNHGQCQNVDDSSYTGDIYTEKNM